MFTGLIEEIGTIKSTQPSGEGKLIEVQCDHLIGCTKNGDSISINGACQTVTALTNKSFTVFASKVTCDVTTLGSLNAGDRVNLERAMSSQSRFDGHIVQGHVDTTGTITSIKRDSEGMNIYISVDPDYMRYIVSKGSIAVDGISLTVVSVLSSGFTLYLIPETMSKTIINAWNIGSSVNIEVDILAKYVENMLRHGTGLSHSDKDEILKQKLMEEGFI